MADPTTIIGGIGLGTSVLGALTGAVGGVRAGEAQGQQYEAASRTAQYQAGIARMNQQIAKQNADYALATGEVSAQEAGMKARFAQGATKTTQAAGNLDIGSGSARDVQESQEELGQHDQAIIRSNAARAAYGFQVEGAKDVAQAGLYDMAASDATRAAGTARTTGQVTALTSILGGAASVSSRWLQGRQVGLWGNSSTADI